MEYRCDRRLAGVFVFAVEVCADISPSLTEELDNLSF